MSRQARWTDVRRQCLWVSDRRVARRLARRMGGRYTMHQGRWRTLYRYTFPEIPAEYSLAI